MFSLSSYHRFEFYAKACDMRKGFDSLCGLVRNELARDPTCGEVFVFLNRPRNMIKMLHWEVGGLVIYHKRLEKGTFAIPKLMAGQSQIHWPEFVLMIEGISVEKVARKRRFEVLK